MGTPCNLTGSTDYAPRHVPFLYYTNVQQDTSRCMSHVVDYSNFTTDLAGTLPQFAFISPNLTDDMHGTSFLTPQTTDINNGDKWLMANIPTITTSSAFQNGGLLVIVWDEDDGSGGLTGTDDPIALFVMSPYAKTGKYTSPTHADHYSLLATVEDGLGLARLGNAMTAQPLTDFFPAQ